MSVRYPTQQHEKKTTRPTFVWAAVGFRAQTCIHKVGGDEDATRRSRLFKQRAISWSSDVVALSKLIPFRNVLPQIQNDYLSKRKCCRSVPVGRKSSAGSRRTRLQFRFAKSSDRRGCNRQSRSSSWSSIRRTLWVQTGGSQAIGHSPAIRTNKRSNGLSS